VHRVEAVFTGHLSAEDLKGLPGVSDVHVQDRLLRCAVQGSIKPVLDQLAGADVVELDSQELSLEEVFLGELTHS